MNRKLLSAVCVAALTIGGAAQAQDSAMTFFLATNPGKGGDLGGPVLSKVILVGQAPGVKEPVLGKPFAWTAGRTLFGWFQQFCGMTEEEVSTRIYFAAVCRCFPGKTAAGGDH